MIYKLRYNNRALNAVERAFLNREGIGEPEHDYHRMALRFYSLKDINDYEGLSREEKDEFYKLHDIFDTRGKEFNSLISKR